MSLPPIIVDDLDRAIDRYVKELGFRLEMIKPADAPHEALLSEPPAVAGGLASRDELRFITLRTNKPRLQPPATAGGSDWVRGRAGMEYRDLVPDRMGGKLIVSHIRLTEGGQVPDYVHYHKIDLQIIYCLTGRIKVVYEDQGPPFWLEAGDCVLQPPEIRHRVLECEAGSEVIEVTSPGEHETWVEHEMGLPTDHFTPNRDFGGQRFVRRNAAENETGDMGIAAATSGRFDAGISSNGAGQRTLWVKLADGETLSIDL